MTPLQAHNPIDYLAIGHAARDLTPKGSRLGGTVSYAGLAANALGLRVGVVTSASDRLDLSPLNPLAVHRIPAEQSTAFENTYAADVRAQTISGIAEPLRLVHVPQEWRSAGIVHLAPIAAEVDLQLAKCFPDSFLAVTPQGWMRTWDDEGSIRLGPWDARPR